MVRSYRFKVLSVCNSTRYELALMAASSFMDCECDSCESHQEERRRKLSFSTRWFRAVEEQIMLHGSSIMINTGQIYQGMHGQERFLISQ